MTPTTNEVADVFVGGGEMGALMRSLDWSQTPFGPPDTWSPSLRSMVRILLANRFPLLLWWGPDHNQLYNDAYRPVLGAKHPQYLGRPGRECWSEIWDVIGPLVQTPYTGGPATWDDDIFLVLKRHGFSEETHFTIAYSPIPDDTVPSGIGGVLATVHEITRQVIQERRAVALRDLGARSSEAKSAEEACEIAAKALAQHPKEIPFALLYLLDADRQGAYLAGMAGAEAGHTFSPPTIALTASDEDRTTWPLGQVVRDERPLLVERLEERFGTVPPGPWSDPPDRALVLPIPSNIQHRPAGVLVLGISAWLDFDDLYRGFCDLVTAQVSTAIANARAYEEERKRAEALAALDQAKTAFFSNISHEFRTPLTLMLGPLEDALAQPPGALSAEDRERLTVAHRNALRLLRLVNTLLDFSRIEAGRIQASFEPTDLPGYTAELASTFRSALERAGLALTVDCPPLPPGVEAYVDREMWEKIVLNLLSNAFKFTFEGEVEVALRDGGRRPLPGRARHRHRHRRRRAAPPVRAVPPRRRVPGPDPGGHRDRAGARPGAGCAPRRRHRGRERARARHQVHGDDPDRVRAPAGRAGRRAAHPGVDRAGEPRVPGRGARLALRRAVGVLTSRHAPAAPSEPAAPPANTVRPRILVADDNRDMREYVVRLLRSAYTVQAVTDGEQALASALADPPDLVLSDVMMPGLDGFGLVSALRADPRTHEVPIVLLSARAGEEARIEGVQAGADDYLVKPFAREGAAGADRESVGSVAPARPSQGAGSASSPRGRGGHPRPRRVPVDRLPRAAQPGRRHQGHGAAHPTDAARRAPGRRAPGPLPQPRSRPAATA